MRRGESSVEYIGRGGVRVVFGARLYYKIPIATRSARAVFKLFIFNLTLGGT